MSARGRGELLSARVTPSNLRSSPSFPTIVVTRLEFRGGGSIACGGIEGRRVVGEPTEANHDDDASIHSGPRLIEPPPASVTYNLTWESMQPYVT